MQDWDGNVIQESVHQFPGKFTENLWVNLPIVWTYKGIHNVFSCATDTVYAVTKDSIYPRYYIPEGKYKREICDRHTKVNWDFFTDAIQLGSIAETKDFLLFSFDLHQKYWFCRYNEIKKIVTESTNVKFPEKRQQLLDLIDSMGPDDNPILAIYKLKD